MDILTSFVFVDWLAIVIVACLFGLIIGAESSALAAYRKHAAGGILCLAGGLLYILMTTDPGQSVFFSQFATENPHSPAARKKKNREAMATNDGRKPGEDSTGPGDGEEEDGEDAVIQIGGADIGLKGGKMHAGVAKNGKNRGKGKKKRSGKVGLEGEEGAGNEEGESEFTPEKDENGKENRNAGRDCPTCPLMVLVPKGTSTLGAGPEELGFREHEGPAREIVMRRYFYIGRFEITRGEFKEYLAATEQSAPQGCFADGVWRKDFGFEHTGFDQTDEHPAVCIGRDDALGYAQWLSKKTKKAYRLPSESEWEHAARAGATWPFHWGNDIDITDANFGEIYRGTTPVGRFYPNALRIFDMSGNAWEMVEDCWSPDLTTRAHDGKAVTQQDCKNFVMKGGGWYNSPVYLRLAARWTHMSGAAGTGVGFRLVREYELDPEAPKKPGEPKAQPIDAISAAVTNDDPTANQARTQDATATSRTPDTTAGQDAETATQTLKQLQDLRLRGSSR